MTIALTIFLVLNCLAIPAWDIYWIRRRRQELHSAMPVTSIADCVFAQRIEAIDQLPTAECRLVTQKGHWKAYRDNCPSRCERSVHKQTLFGVTLNLSDMSTILVDSSVLAKAGTTLLLSAVPTVIAIQKIWS